MIAASPDPAVGREGMKSMALRSATGCQPFDLAAIQPRAGGQVPQRRAFGSMLVNCDATWADGVGFIAISGALGEHARRVDCADNICAEALAILFAMDLAEPATGRAPRLIFRTDCAPVAMGAQLGVRANRNKEVGRLFARIRRTLAHRKQFEVQHVSRSNVRVSHELCRAARSEYLTGAPVAFKYPLWAPEMAVTERRAA